MTQIKECGTVMWIDFKSPVKKVDNVDIPDFPRASMNKWKWIYVIHNLLTLFNPKKL